MGLTVASGTLDTSWQEFSIVDFTAGTLGTLSACIDEVEVKLNRGTLSATTTPSTTKVADWISRAKQEVAETKQYTWKRRFVYATTTASQYRYSLPPDYDGGKLSIRDMTNDRKIRVIDGNLFDTWYPDMSKEANGAPKVATIKNREIWLGPPSSANITIELEYDRSGDDITAGDISWLPEMARFLCCDFATAESFRSLHQWKAAQIYDDRWMAGLGKSVKADGKRKWSGVGFRCKSIFEAQ
jgi:hypothetical protein